MAYRRRASYSRTRRAGGYRRGYSRVRSARSPARRRGYGRGRAASGGTIRLVVEQRPSAPVMPIGVMNAGPPRKSQF